MQEAQKYLEAVYAVAPIPEAYVRYRLALATALPLELLDAWFELRHRTSHSGQSHNLNTALIGAPILDLKYTPCMHAIMPFRRMPQHMWHPVTLLKGNRIPCDNGAEAALMSNTSQHGNLGELHLHYCRRLGKETIF